MTTLPADSNQPWWKLLNGYHWFVLIVAALGWLFDCLDQQIFLLARVPAMKALLDPGQNINEFSGYATAIFLIGWAVGGLFFGVLGDRIGRAKTMLITILLYSVFTGLSALSTGFWDFALYRFLTGLGVGGEFAVGVALVAEVMPDRARPYALGLLQALSAVGNVSAALISIGFGHLETTGAIGVGSGWRWMFFAGAFPALLAIVIRMKLKEPQKWVAAKAADTAKKLGSYGELFGNPNWKTPAVGAGASVAIIILIAFAGPDAWNKLVIGVSLALVAIGFLLWTVFGGGKPASEAPWRRNAIVGLTLACAGVIGLWGIVFFVFDLVGSVLGKQFAAAGMPADQIPGEVIKWKGIASLYLNGGAFFGIYGFGLLSQRIGRRPTFAIAFIAAMITTAFVFLKFNSTAHVAWMMPLLGFTMLGIFGGYAIYFPELFPTHLRSTGTSFCYNVGRFVSASGPAVLGLLTSRVFSEHDEPMRYAGVCMCAIFLVGLAVLPFAPETRGRPLPE
ncbi:MAG TPA: MFS transporter [Verrucomicrobiales bacterium]|nr:MFS transporter [Verrucomicrobiales bacterium]